MIDLRLGDCLEVMKTLPDGCVDAVVTDPPYGLEFMGKEWDHGIPGVPFWTEAIRVAKPGAYLLAFGGTRTFHRLACAIEDAGWEIRDCVMWVYGSGFPKSHNLHGAWDGWGTALKPAWEPVIVARKPLEGTVAQNVLKWGTGAMNIDASRVKYVNEEPPDLEHWKKTSGGWKNTSTAGVVPNDNSLGRWPANLIHDGSDEVVELMPQTKSGARQGGDEYKLGRYEGQAGARGLKTGGTCEASSGSAARFFYCAKASKKERDAGCEGLEVAPGGSLSGGADTRGDSPKTNQPLRRNNHPTVKPVALMRYLITLVTQPGGTVLDPFMGSGSTGVAAKEGGFGFLGIEKEPEYLEIAKKRIEEAQLQMRMEI